MLPDDLVKSLICPKCRGELQYQVNQQVPSSGKLICQSCRLSFRVEEDIPVMLIDQAEQLPEEDSGTV